MEKSEFLETVRRIIATIDDEIGVLFEYDVSDDPIRDADFGVDTKGFLRILQCPVPYKCEQLEEIRYAIYKNLDGYDEERGYIRFIFGGGSQIDVNLRGDWYMENLRCWHDGEVYEERDNVLSILKAIHDGCINFEDVHYMCGTTYYGYNGKEDKISIPEGVKNLLGVSRYRNRVREITLPDSLEEIGHDVFADMNIESIDLKNVEKIGQRAFMRCKNLKKIEIPSKVKEIEVYTFHASGISSIDLKNVEKIGCEAFSLCYNLKHITIPATVTEINAYAFQSSGISSIDQINNESKADLSKLEF